VDDLEEQARKKIANNGDIQMEVLI
jgi:hypothetical protein